MSRGRHGDELLGFAVGSSTKVGIVLSRFMHRASAQALQELWVTIVHICGCLCCHRILDVVCHVTTACTILNGSGGQDDNVRSSSHVGPAGSAWDYTKEASKHSQ